MKSNFLRTFLLPTFLFLVVAILVSCKSAGKETTYTITYTAQEGGEIIGTTPQTVKKGESGTQVTARAQTSFRFVKWDNDDTNPSRTETNVQANITRNAIFQPIINNIKEFKSQGDGLAGVYGLITEDDRLFMWGNNVYGQLGNGETNEYGDIVTTPTEVTLPQNEKPKELVIGLGFTAVISLNDKFFFWGNNYNGQLGLGHRETPVTSPVENTTLSNLRIKSFELGGPVALGFAGAIDENNDVYMWGSNTYGQLGNGTISVVSAPTKITLNSNISTPKKLSLGLEHSSLLTETNQVFAWGRNQNGQVGVDITNPSFSTPQLVTFPEGETPIDINMKRNVSTVITEEKNLFAWGAIVNINGTNAGTPIKIDLPEDEEIDNWSVSSNSASSYIQILTKSKKVYIRGRNTYGHFPDKAINGTFHDFSLISFPNNVIPQYSQIDIMFSFIISEDNELYFWGTRHYLGQENPIDYRTPTKVEIVLPS